MSGDSRRIAGASVWLGKKQISRRRLLDGGAALGAYFLLPRPAGAADPPPHDHMNMAGDPGPVAQAAPAAMDMPLVEPEVRRSANGVLSTTLSTRYIYKDIGGVRLYVRSYDGMIPGPTLRMQPGETLRIRLSNDFPPNRDVMPMNMALPHQFNNTNFHFHGSHTSPSGISDNVMRTMLPGKSYD